MATSHQDLTMSNEEDQWVFRTTAEEILAVWIVLWTYKMRKLPVTRVILSTMSTSSRFHKYRSTKLVVFETGTVVDGKPVSEKACP